jgi:hypothetical protein
MNLLRRVLSRGSYSRQLDTGRVGECLASVREMEKIAGHQSGLLLTMATWQHSKPAWQPTSLLLKGWIARPKKGCLDSPNDTKKR